MIFAHIYVIKIIYSSRKYGKPIFTFNTAYYKRLIKKSFGAILVRTSFQSLIMIVKKENCLWV